MSIRLHLDCVGGIAGDMFMAALSGLLPDLQPFSDIMARLDLGDWSLSFGTRTELGIAARHLDLRLPPESDRIEHPAEIRKKIEAAGLPQPIEKDALAMLALIAEAEGKVHGKEPEHVHFHELAGLDLIVDLVGAATLVHLLQPIEITSTPLPMGHGLITIEHGTMPLPAPATAELLKGVPVRPSEIKGETVTPTGAAIVRHFVTRFVESPQGVIKRLSISAGDRRNPTIPNILRAYGCETAVGETRESIVELACNIDDMNPEHYEYLMQRLFEAGARDVWLTPIIMKKSRPAVCLQLLATQADESALTEILFIESTTLGVRRREITRRVLPRESETRQTAFGPVTGKRVDYADGSRWKPEYEELKRLAAETGLPLRLIAERLALESPEA
jgi:uncharacterized protein (TIGR00299 family) protein